MKKFLSLFLKEPNEIKTKFSVLEIITTVFALFGFFCFFNFFTSVFIDGSNLLIPLLALAVCAATLVPVIFRKRLRTWLKAVFCAGLGFFAVTFCIFCFVVTGFSREVKLPGDNQKDVVAIVYGCRTYDEDRPSAMLKRRLDAAAEFLTLHCPNALCIVSGGQGANEPCTEALAMRNYLIKAGVYEARIIMEDTSANTVENLGNSLELMKKLRIDDYTVVSISDNYHLMRIDMIAEDYGIETMIYPAEISFDFRYISSLTREYLSYIKMLIL
nr:YdcF family protein [Clostridia bacterium]